MFTTKSLVMKLIRLIFSVCFLLVFGYCFGQDGTPKSQEERTQEETDRLKRIEARRRAYERDPQAFRDSVANLRKREAEEEAQRRLARYKANDKVDTLKRIDLSHCLLTEVPDFVLEAWNLERLILDHNSIRKLPRQLKKLEKLAIIQWGHNEFERRVRFPRMTAVTDLRFTGNNVDRLPAIRKFKNLTKLDISGNALSAIPIRKIKRNDYLKEVIIKENPLILSEAKYRKLTNVSVLKLNKCDIEFIDPSFYEMENLSELQLQENKLSSLPDGISEMKNLSKLSFYKNNLESLPEDFFDVPNLVVVDLYYNELQKIPSSIAKAQDLEILYMANNRIYDVPEELGELSGLEELYLHHNRISALPSSISKLGDLRVLRVNDNYLVEFPKQVLELKKLQELDLNNNELREIPMEISELTELQLFTFNGNNIDLNAFQHQDLARQIYFMTQRGIICKPSVRMEVTGGD